MLVKFSLILLGIRSFHTLDLEVEVDPLVGVEDGCDGQKNGGHSGGHAHITVVAVVLETYVFPYNLVFIYKKCRVRKKAQLQAYEHKYENGVRAAHYLKDFKSHID